MSQRETMHTREEWHGNDEGGNSTSNRLKSWRAPELNFSGIDDVGNDSCLSIPCGGVIMFYLLVKFL